VSISAAELLTKLDDNGIQLRSVEGEIEVTPMSALDDALKADIKKHGAALEQILELQDWQQALEENHSEFLSGGENGNFGRFFDEWYSREQLLRNVIGYTGCIWGDGKECPESVVRCEQCSPTPKKRRFKSL
jgi:hypothetical protein|tara:strand:+ start:496 stop:891 length:396 start_codon:yes stop_codon:yes gene_type:complete